MPRKILSFIFYTFTLLYTWKNSGTTFWPRLICLYLVHRETTRFVKCTKSYTNIQVVNYLKNSFYLIWNIMLQKQSYWQFYIVTFQNVSMARTVVWLRFIADNAKYKNSTDHNASRHFLFYSDKSQRITAFCHSTLHNLIMSITHHDFFAT